MRPSKTRAFICVDFPSEIIKETAQIQSLIEKQNFTGRLTELENIHLTLKFLGEIDDKTLSQVKGKLSTIKFHKLNMQVESCGVFTFKRKPRIAWIKFSGVERLQKQIDETLKDLFPKEERFMSHVTIARIKYAKNKSGFSKYVSNIKPKKIKFNSDNFKLKSSDLQPQGPVYITLETYKSG